MFVNVLATILMSMVSANAKLLFTSWLSITNNMLTGLVIVYLKNTQLYFIMLNKLKLAIIALNLVFALL